VWVDAQLPAASSYILFHFLAGQYGPQWSINSSVLATSNVQQDKTRRSEQIVMAGFVRPDIAPYRSLDSLP
jgi:hypothetical protein